MIIEIGYTYTADKNSPALVSWTYFYVKGDELDKAKAKAKTYWKKFCNELGYKPSQVKLNHIEAIQNEKSYAPNFIVVSQSELPPARKRTSKAQTRASRVSRSSPSPKAKTKSTRKKSV